MSLLDSLTVITVAYRSRGDLPGLLDSVAADAAACGASAPPQTIVVDNTANDPAAEVGTMVAQRHGWAQYIPAPRNMGMGAGLNLGATHARGAALLLVNPDVRLRPGLLTGMAGYVAHETAGRRRPCIVGPRLLNGDGSLQLSAGRFPNLPRLVAGRLLWPRSTRLYIDCSEDRPCRVDWLTGAVMGLSRASFERLGGFDEGYFLYYEEVDLCRRARQLGIASVYEPRLVCEHLHPLQDRPVSGVVAGYIRASRWRYVSRYGGPLELAALGLADRLGLT